MTRAETSASVSIMASCLGFLVWASWSGLPGLGLQFSGSLGSNGRVLKVMLVLENQVLQVMLSYPCSTSYAGSLNINSSRANNRHDAASDAQRTFCRTSDALRRRDKDASSTSAIFT